MILPEARIEEKFHQWLKAWNSHDLHGVLDFIHPQITFITWDEKAIKGKEILEKAWNIWFSNHENFIFVLEDFSIDEKRQKLTFAWELEWPSKEFKKRGLREKRKGLDLLTLKSGKIIHKETYSKTVIKINSKTNPDEYRMII